MLSALFVPTWSEVRNLDEVRGHMSKSGCGEMELCGEVLAGLEAAGSSGSLKDEAFKSALSTSLSTALDPASANPQDGGDGVCKEVCFALSTLLLELARLDTDPSTMSTLLEDVKMEPSRAKLLTKSFIENKAKLRAALDRMSSDGTPHLVDAQWRLDYYMKNNHTEKVNRAEYLIELNTETSGCSDAIQFACTQEQLQDLVSSLKDATKSLGRIAQ